MPTFGEFASLAIDNWSTACQGQRVGSLNLGVRQPRLCPSIARCNVQFRAAKKFGDDDGGVAEYTSTWWTSPYKLKYLSSPPSPYRLKSFLVAAPCPWDRNPSTPYSGLLCATTFVSPSFIPRNTNPIHSFADVAEFGASHV